MVSFAPKKHQEAGKKYTNPGSHQPNPLSKADLWYPSGDQGGSLDVGFFLKKRDEKWWIQYEYHT